MYAMASPQNNHQQQTRYKTPVSKFYSSGAGKEFWQEAVSDKAVKQNSSGIRVINY